MHASHITSVYLISVFNLACLSCVVYMYICACSSHTKGGPQGRFLQKVCFARWPTRGRETGRTVGTTNPWGKVNSLYLLYYCSPLHKYSKNVDIVFLWVKPNQLTFFFSFLCHNNDIAYMRIGGELSEIHSISLYAYQLIKYRRTRWQMLVRIYINSICTLSWHTDAPTTDIHKICYPKYCIISITDVENSLLGLQPLYLQYFNGVVRPLELCYPHVIIKLHNNNPSHFVSHLQTPPEVICFGHVLFQMTMGFTKAKANIADFASRMPKAIYDVNIAKKP